MEKELKNTVSPLIFGSVKVGRNTCVKYPEKFDIPSDECLKNLLDRVNEMGVTYLDTAPAYGVSEERLGKIIKDKSKWSFMTKVGEEFVGNKSFFDFSKKHVFYSVERSLKRLGIDCLDAVLLHSDGNDLQIMRKNTNYSESVEALIELKKQGKVKNIGISTKTEEGNNFALQWSDFIMTEYNSGMSSEEQEKQKRFFIEAKKKRVQVIIKKAFASGHLIGNKNSIVDALKFIYDQPISSIVLGSLSVEHWKQNCDIINKILNK
jgi:aryl-alcohol dehydrogenase-like predicted oxidoreductase